MMRFISSRLARSLVLHFVLLFFGANAFAQSTISGTVNNASGEPLSGVTVSVKGTAVTTSTNENGRFTLNVGSTAQTLVFSSVGFVSLEESVSGRNVVNVVMTESAEDLQSVVVVGFGKQSRETVTTSISKLDQRVLQTVPYANVASAMQGTLPGVRVQSISGQPGAAPRVIIRGGTSINNPNGASPLYIVDGVIRTQIDNITSDDIESLQVLKDAASTAIFGARGSNGVVIITTKSGKAGKTQVSYRFDRTISKPGKLWELASARDYITLSRLGEVQTGKFTDTDQRNQSWGFGTGNDLTNNTAFTTMYLSPENEHKLNEGWESMPDPLDPSKTIIFKETDFQDLMFQTGISNNHFVEVSGGTDKAVFNAGAGYLSSQGTIITTKYDRLSFNLNGNLKVKDNLSFFGRVLYSKARKKEPFALSSVTYYRQAALPPTAKFEFEDGTIAPGINSSTGNPVYYMNSVKNGRNIDNLTVAAGAHWEILPGLSFDPQLSIYNIYDDAWTFQPAYWDGPLTYVTSRDATASQYRWNQRQADAVLTYARNIGSSHNLEAKAGFSYFKRTESRLSAAGRNAATDLIPTLNAVGMPVSVFSNISDNVLLGYFSRINYDYRKKYLLSVNMRYDGASNLGEKNKWGFFPGISAGWNMHNENFWSLGNLLHLKLRASYGVNGNISGLGDFTGQGEYGVNATYSGGAAIQNTVLQNQDLQWEQSKTIDFGMDVGLFNDRIQLLVDYYRRETDNLLTNLTLPPSTGFRNILTNFGTLENKGFELELRANITNPTSLVQWNVSFNAAKTKAKILRLPDNGVERNRVGGVLVWDGGKGDYDWKGGLQEGGTIGEMYDRKQLGIYATDAEAANAPVDSYIPMEDKTKYGGDVNWQDTDGNGIIDSRDQVYMGNQFPVWTGGFSNTLSYKNLSLYFRLDYTTGHNIFNWAKLFFEAELFTGVNMTQDVVDGAWRKQGDIATKPRYYQNGFYVQRNNFNGTKVTASSDFQEPGDFLCIREVSLSYSVPANVLRKVRMSNLRLHVTGNNLHYFTKYTGLNPEDGGIDDGRYPIPKNVIFGASVSF